MRTARSAVGAAVDAAVWRLIVVKAVVTIAIIGYAAAMIWLRLREAQLNVEEDAPSRGSGSGSGPGTPAYPVSNPAEGVAAFVHRLLFGAHGDGLVVLLLKLWIVTIVLLLMASVVARATATEVIRGGAASC